jgi:hypothetical protein
VIVTWPKRCILRLLACNNVLGGSSKQFLSSSSDRCISEISSITENSLFLTWQLFFRRRLVKVARKTDLRKQSGL